MAAAHPIITDTSSSNRPIADQSRAAITLPRDYSFILWGAIIAIPMGLAMIAFLSPAWVRGTTTADHPVLALTALLVITSGLWLGGMVWLGKYEQPLFTHTLSRLTIGALFLSGLFARLIFFDSTPIYEDDWERYLWDGAVSAQGINPYHYTPEEIRMAAQPGTASEPDLARLALLARTSEGTIDAINNPDLTTIYPPVAQAAFALAYLLDPFGTVGLQTVFLLSDLAALALLLVALNRWRKPSAWAAIYWLNPILIFTVYSGLHMDVLLMAPLLAALIWARERPVVGGLALSVAAAIKIWPLLLAPLLFRHLRAEPLKLAGLVTLLAGLSLLLLAPMLLNLRPDAGLAAYSSGWVNSSFLFPGLRDALSLISENPDGLARILVTALTLIISLTLGLFFKDDVTAVPAQALILIACLIWLSPTGYPWYLIWLLPFLALAPRLWVGAVFIGAAAYYGRFWLGENDLYAVYTRGLVPLWFGAPLLLLALHWRQSHVRYA